MKKAFLLLAMLPFFSSCVSMMLDTRLLDVFTAIENNTPYDIHYYQGVKHCVKVHACEADLPFIKTSVIHGQLYVNYDPSHPFRSKPYVEVYSPHFNQYQGLGKGDFRAKKPVQANDMVLDMKGTGSARFKQVTAGNLEVKNHGSGNVRVGDGKVQGKTTVTNQGSGNVKGRVDTPEFDGRTTHTGDIRMKGNANTVTTKQESTGRTEYRRTGGSRTERDSVKKADGSTSSTGGKTASKTGSDTKKKTRGGR